MKKNELEQYLYEHPNLLDDSFSGSMTEAEQWAKEHPVSASDVIAHAKEKHPEISAEAWKDFEKAAAKADKRKKTEKAAVVRIRWWQVAIAAAVLIVLTFTLVPPARAWAESIIRYIFHVDNEAIDIMPENELITHWTPSPEERLCPTDDPNEPEDEDEYDWHQGTYPDVETFISDVEYHPVIAALDGYTIKEINYFVVPNAFDEVRIDYESSDGMVICVFTTWGPERGASLFPDDNDVVVRTTALDGAEAVGYVDTTTENEKGCTFGIVLEDSVVVVMYSGELDYQTVLDALQFS